MVEEELKSDFCLEINFEENSSEAPSRVFKAMSGLIDGIQLLDSSLGQAIDANIRTQLILHTIEVGSLKSWLRNIVEIADDENLKKLNLKDILGKYLVEAKHWALKHLKDKESPKDVNIKEVQEKLHEIAEKTNLRKIPSYPLVKRKTLAEFYITTSESTSVLAENDSAKYVSSRGEIVLPKGHSIPDEIKEEMVTQETTTDETVLVLKVKKPDYLGRSKWIFRYGRHPIEAGIEDEKWLSQFQERKVIVRPGDCLKARVRTEIKKGYDGEDVSVRYDLIKVMEVIRADNATQSTFFPEDEKEL